MAARYSYLHHTLLRTLVSASLAASLAGFGAMALAREPAAARSASGALATNAATAAAAASAPAASGSVPVRPQATPASAISAVPAIPVKATLDAPKRGIKLPSAQDPLDRVRERLAEKLGAPRAVAAAEPNTLRVATRAPTAALIATSRAGAATRRADVARSGVGAHERLSAEPAHWDHAGTDGAAGVGVGPDRWGALRPEFSKCSTGSRQSPIDIRDGIKVDLDPVAFDYKPSAFRVIDNGHTVQVNVGPGNSIEVAGRRYELLQFHFHRPSEERVNGKQFDMVAHLVHKDIDGRLAVVAVLLDRGTAHPLVQSVWNNLPLEKGDEVAARATLDLNTLLPNERSYFTYMGSLTTPPCSEGVLWLVLKASMPISIDQINIFARLYPMNARPIQALGGRLIKESN